MLAADGGAVVRGPGGALVVCAESLVECLWGAAVECAPNLWCVGLGQGRVGTLWHAWQAEHGGPGEDREAGMRVVGVVMGCWLAGWLPVGCSGLGEVSCGWLGGVCCG